MFLKTQTFFLFGLSRSGRAVGEFLLKNGAKVYVYDDMPSAFVEDTERELVNLGAIKLEKETVQESVGYCDAIVLSPGIPIDHPLAVLYKKNKKAVLGETEIATRFLKNPIVAITGTNGKTTTTTMIASALSDGGIPALACGNIGKPMTELIDKPTTVAVAEISSFQLETLASICPHIAVVLNITEDHLNRHYTMENYVFLKRKLLKNLTETEYAVLNYDDEIVRSFASGIKAKTEWFSLKEKVDGAYVENGSVYYKDELILDVSDLPLSGEHNVANALASTVVAKLMGVETEKLKNSLRSFKGVPHRIEKVGEINDVLYIDDSKGTNIDATKKAVSSMERDTVLLLGGKDKGYDYESLFQSLKNSKAVFCVLYGENRFRLIEGASKASYLSFALCPNFEMAVYLASKIAKPGQSVLLSPASASFDEFTSYEERGERFVSLVQRLKEESGWEHGQSSEQISFFDDEENKR